MRVFFTTSIPTSRALAVAFVLISAAGARADSLIYDQALSATGWLIVPQAKGTAAGTCWLADRERKLVVTSYHVVRESPQTLVYFPRRVKGKLIVHTAWYLRKVSAIRGRVIAADKYRDLALVQLDSLPASVKPLTLAAASAGPGDDVHSIGNSGCSAEGDLAGGTLWRYTRGNVRQVYTEKVDTPDGKEEIQLVETQSPVNRGDSGGPVVNDQGELVGVTFFYKTKEQLVSYDVDVREVRHFLSHAVASLDKVAATSPAPKKTATPEEFVPTGLWKVTLQVKESKPLIGNGRFEKDGTFEITGGELTGFSKRSGRFSYANRVLWLIESEVDALLHITWQNADHFSTRSGEIELTFERQKQN